jgi:glycosyltransferase involved in cell wall biosynthesis
MLTRFPGADVETVPNCIDLDELSTFRRTGAPVDRVLAFVGHVQPTKGINELLESWQEVRGDDWRLQLIGPGDTAYFEDLRARFDMTRVEFVGEKTHEEAMRLLGAAAGFVFPSYSEGFPNAVLEAMALGKPILASGVGAIPEMLSGDCGIVIPPRNVEALRDALGTLMNDAVLRQGMGARARRKAEQQYSLPAVFQRYVDIWKTVSSGKKSEARTANERAG